MSRVLILFLIFGLTSTTFAGGIDHYSDTVNKFWQKRIHQYYRMNGSPLQSEDELKENTRHRIPEIQIAGDSWAVFTCVFGSAYFGLAFTGTRAHISPCFDMGKFGINSDEWLASSTHRHTLNALTANKNIKILYLVLAAMTFSIIG